VRIGAVLFAAALLSAACVDNRIVVTTPTPTAVVATTPPPVATTATPSPSPSPTPTPTPLTISGEASVFEAALIWQVTDTAGRVLASGFTTATAGAPSKGTFSVSVTYQDPPSDIIGFAEVYTRSPKDGEIDEIVRVPLILLAAR
jgi:hypothetical protein